MIENMSDDQLKDYIEKLKSNKEMAKQAFAMSGQNMTDEQLDMTMNMMSPEMMRMSANMQKNMRQ